jgi:hypothetical protein
LGVTDGEFEDMVTGAVSAMPGAEAVMLGGSRARGDYRPDSDWDFAVYYRGDVPTEYFDSLGWPGTVYRPGEWGQVMYGGAVFDLDGRHFDIHYRNLDVVEHWTAEAAAGRFSVHQLGFHVAGIPTYMLAGELATGRMLLGELDRPAGYPEALRVSAPEYWFRRAASELDYAQYWVDDANAVSLAASLARATLETAHARLAGAGHWALNEKRMVRQAGLDDLIPVLGAVGTTRAAMARSLERVRELLTKGGRRVDELDD